MRNAISTLVDMLSRTHLVEFDYTDSTGRHHGRCYVRCLFGNRQQTQRLMRSFGYTNIHIF